MVPDVSGAADGALAAWATGAVAVGSIGILVTTAAALAARFGAERGVEPVPRALPLASAVATGLAAACVAWSLAVGRLPLTIAPAAFLLVWVLAVGASVDAVTRRIPDALTVGLGPVVASLALVAAARDPVLALGDVVLGLTVLPASLELLAQLARPLAGERGIGRGDVKLAVAVGPVVAAAGPAELAVLAVVTGLAALPPALVAAVARRGTARPRIALGPPLAIGAVVTLVGGRPLTAALVSPWAVGTVG